MNKSLMTIGLAGAALLAPWIHGAGLAQESAEGGGLKRLAPLAPGAPGAEPVPADAQRPAQASPQAFDGDLWRFRLSEADLAAREAWFDGVVDLAQRDGAARAWLEAEASGGADPVLAWTCRLALRELGRRPEATWRVIPGLPEGMLGDLDARLERLFGAGASRIFPLHAGKGHWGKGSFGASGVTVEQDADGVRVVVTEQVDGDERKTEYRAESMDALLEEHPELRERLELGHGLDLRIGGKLLPDVEGMLLELQQDLRGLGRPMGMRAVPRAVAPRDVPTDVLGVYLVELPAARRAELGLAEGVGLLVNDTAPRTIARQLGLRARDVLIEVGGRPIATREDVSAALRARPAGGELAVAWYDSAGDLRRATWRPAPAEEPSAAEPLPEQPAEER